MNPELRQDMKPIFSLFAFAIIASGLSGFAGAQAKPEDTIKSRKTSLTLVQTHMKDISAMLKGERPMDAALVAKNAALIDTLAKSFPDGFPAGTGLGDTKAKPEIWSQPDRFKQMTSSYQAEAAKFNAVAKTSDVDNIKTQFGVLAKTCGTCHIDFRTK